ncbi:MAG: FmdB family zinc ribbon protein [Acidobacteriota bacterium]
MPIYEFTCRACGRAFEALVRVGAIAPCPGCASAEVERRISLPALKSETTHALALKAAQKRDKIRQAENTRAQLEYERSHD